MTKAQMMAMSDVEVRLRLENVRLRMKIVAMMLGTRSASGSISVWSSLIRRKNRLRTQEKKRRGEIARRAAASETRPRVIGKKTWDDSFVVINEERRGSKS